MKNFMAMITTLLVCAGCTEEILLPEPHGQIGLTVSVTDAAGYPSAKTAITNNSTASFSASDKIGIYETLTNRSNVPYTYNGTSWSTPAPMYWYNGTSTHTFYAYYPYNAGNQNNLVPIPLLSTQQVNTKPDTNCDMLVAGPKTQVRNTGGTTVPLTFTHAFALLEFNIKIGLLNILNPYVLKTITLSGGNPKGSALRYGMINVSNAVGKIGYNLATGIQHTVNDSTVYTQTLQAAVPSIGLIATPTLVYMLVLPGSYHTPAPSIKFRGTTILLGGLLSDWESENANLSNTTFNAGTKYHYEVKIGGLLGSRSVQVEKTAETPLLPCEIKMPPGQ